MKNLILIVLFVAAVSAQAQENWETVKTKDGKASIIMPSVPEMVVEKVPSEVGEVIMNIQILDMSAEDGDNMTMGIMSLEYPINMTDSLNSPAKLKEFYDGAMNGAANNMGGSIISQEDIEMNGYDGRQFKIDLMGGMAIITMKYFQVGDTGYIAQIISKGDAQDNEDAKRFLNSFSIQ